MRKYLILLTALFVSFFLTAQENDSKAKIYKLGDKIMSGDANALRELANYIDDTSHVIEFLGWHNYSTTVQNIVLRTIQENCLLNDNELKAYTNLTSSEFLKILSTGKLRFDEITGMFLITTLKERKTEYVLKELSISDAKALGKITFPGRFYENKVDTLLRLKDPEALLWIASAWFKDRHRFNINYYSDKQFLTMMRKLTQTDIGVPDQKGDITFLYEDDYYAKAKLNYLVYWFNHYNDYKWNDQKQYFENIKETPAPQSKEDILFPLLYSENDSLAMDAFLRLAEMDTARVKALADDYEKKGSYSGNSILPFYRFSFLRQMTKLTLYCRNKGISYKSSGWITEPLEKLKRNDLKYAERYSIENEIINRLTPSTVTMVEYYGLVNEREWFLGYSIGRILDKYYSKDWRDIIVQESSLLLFLKKAKLFENGTGSHYLRKFEGCSAELFKKVNEIFKTTADNDIRQSAKKIMDNYDPSASREKPTIAARDDGDKYGVDDLKGEYKAILDKYKKKEDRVWPIKQLFAHINYTQLGEAVKILMEDKNWGKYDDPLWLVKNDFGLEINSKSDSSVQKFLEIYNSKDEYGVYEYYLNSKGLTCMDKDDNFIYEKVYDILKFDIVNAFASGSGGSREDGVYPLIRMLELKFGTRLGFGEKLCGSKGVYSCSCIDRAKLWMNYLEDNRFVKINKNEPPSISYYE